MTHAAAAAAIVPVRLGSQRLPGKALLAESGKPLFLHTVEAARAARCFAEVVVATDSDEVERAARAAAVRVVRTSAAPRTGSERCAEALPAIDAGLLVDIQGDWPEVAAQDLEALVALLRDGARCATLATPLTDSVKAEDPNVVKVVCGRDGQALYFSRWPIPYAGAASGPVRRLRHIGVYGFDRATLAGSPDLPSSGLAELESLEQLRWLENAIPIRVLVTQSAPWGIETRADYDAFLARRARRVEARA